MKIVSSTIQYKVRFKYPYCYDDGGPVHDQLWGDDWESVEAETDEQAQIASLDDRFWKKSLCWCRGNTTSYTTSILKQTHEETDDGFVRDIVEEIPLPRNKRCACGKRYWPILGEKPCHELVEL